MLLKRNYGRENMEGIPVLNSLSVLKNKIANVFSKVEETKVTINKSLDIEQDLTVKGKEDVEKDLIVKGKADIGTDLNVKGKTNIQTDLNVNGNIKAKKLCIGGTCIDENRLKILAGTKALYLKSGRGGYLIDKGGWSGNRGSWESMYIT